MSAFDDWNTMERLAQLDPMRQVREANRVIDDLLASSRWHSDYISQSMKDLIGVACPSIAGADFLARQSAMAWTPKYPSWNESSAFSELAEAGEKLRGVGLVKNAGLELQADQGLSSLNLDPARVSESG